jgi:hypothetical protein
MLLLQHRGGVEDLVGSLAADTRRTRPSPDTGVRAGTRRPRGDARPSACQRASGSTPTGRDGGLRAHPPVCEQFPRRARQHVTPCHEGVEDHGSSPAGRPLPRRQRDRCGGRRPLGPLRRCAVDVSRDIVGVDPTTPWGGGRFSGRPDMRDAPTARDPSGAWRPGAAARPERADLFGVRWRGAVGTRCLGWLHASAGALEEAEIRAAAHPSSMLRQGEGWPEPPPRTRLRDRGREAPPGGAPLFVVELRHGDGARCPRSSRPRDGDRPDRLGASARGRQGGGWLLSRGPTSRSARLRADCMPRIMWRHRRRTRWVSEDRRILASSARRGASTQQQTTLATPQTRGRQRTPPGAPGMFATPQVRGVELEPARTPRLRSMRRRRRSGGPWCLRGLCQQELRLAGVGCPGARQGAICKGRGGGGSRCERVCLDNTSFGQ